MNAARQHIIHRQIIEVDIPKGRSVALLQDRIRNTWYDRILPALDNLFSTLVGEEAIIRIDQLDLDLGQINEERLEQQLTSKTLDSIRRQLEEKLRFDTGSSDDLRVVPIRKADTDILLHFLANGRLPWWSPVKDLNSLEAAIMKGGTLAAEFVQLLLETITDTAVIRRLRFQFSTIFLRFLAAKCIPGLDESRVDDPAEALAGYARSAQTAAKNDAPEPGKAPVGTTTSGDDRSKTTLPGESTPSLYKASGDSTQSADKSEPHDEWPAAPGKELPQNGSIDPISHTPDKTDDMPTNTALPTANPSGKTPPSNPEALEKAQEYRDGSTKEEDIPESQSNSQQESSGDSRKQSGKKEKQPGDNGAIYIELAGLVILHPFIRPFFDALGLTEDRQFKDEVSLHKAVHLLGFLATGETDLQEQRLLLPKLLCGMSLTAPIERTGVITETEMKEAENLLAHTIAHWKALKNSSIAALREGFLLREGRLSQVDNGWQLDVEKKTLDILMGSMPWGASVVKLPWMPSLLFVNWG